MSSLSQGAEITSAEGVEDVEDKEQEDQTLSFLSSRNRGSLQDTLKEKKRRVGSFYLIIIVIIVLVALALYYYNVYRPNSKRSEERVARYREQRSRRQIEDYDY